MTEPTGEPGLRLEPGWVTPALAGLAYLLGFLQTAFFASALGVTARDLGLDVKDYTVLALLNAALLALAAGATWLVAAGDERKGRRLLGLPLNLYTSLTGILGVVGVVGLARFGFGVSAGSTWLLVAVSGLWVLGVPLLWRRERVGIATALVVAGVLGLAGLASYSAHVYARELQAAARAGREPDLPPLPMRPALQPEVGVATQGSATTCAIRISPDVLLGRRGVTVATTDRFAVRACDVADVPFG